MNSKTAMPDPVAYAVTNKRQQEFSIALHHDASFAESDNDLLIEDLITTAQAEAYKDACVREALEEAANMCDDVFAFSVGDSIRALMPKEQQT